MNAQRRRENALLKREGWKVFGFDYWIDSLGNMATRKEALRIIVSQAASALAISLKTP